MEYIADNGTPITEAMIDQWAAEAEHAFADGSVTVEPFSGRAWETKTGPMKPRTIRVPDSLWRLVEASAQKRHMTVSQLAREALAKDLTTA